LSKTKNRKEFEYLEAFTEMSLWFRSKYELTEINGVTFISPTSSHGIAFYNPFEEKPLEYLPKTGREHLESCPHVALARINLEDMKEILGFVNKWGLLGLWEFPDILEGDSKLDGYKYAFDEIFKHPHKKGKAARREPLHLFIKAANEFQNYVSDHTQYNDLKQNLALSSAKHNKILDDLLKIGEMDSLDVIKNTAEKHKISKRIINEVIQIYKLSISLFIRTKKYLENCSPLALFTGSPAKDKTGWNFNSLLSAIYLKTTLDKPFQQCPKCRKLYISYVPTNKYCNISCGNSSRQRDSNIKLWKKELKTVFEKQRSSSWVDRQIDVLLEKGVSGRKRLEYGLKQLIEMESK
jgi:hypothetical protein